MCIRDRICNVVFILMKFHSVFPAHKKRSAFVSFDIVDVVNPFKFQDHKLFEKFDILNFQRNLLFSRIQNHMPELFKTCLLYTSGYLRRIDLRSDHLSGMLRIRRQPGQRSEPDLHHTAEYF